LGEAKDLEGAPLGAYRRGVALAPEVAGRGEKKEAAPQAAPASFYDTFWKPLEPVLSGVKHIYLSLDGVLNQVSLGVVPDPDDRLLSERYELRVVNSTKDLLRQRHPPATKAVVLIGNPAFDLEEATQRAAVRSFQKGESLVAVSPAGVVRGSPSRELGGGPLKSLPATQKELEEINGLLRKQQWGVEIYSDQQALEESIKRVRRPRVLHIATHGFFQPDQERTFTELRGERPSGLEDPMLRSGLFFAGANRTLAGQPAAPDLEDGILTAYEVTGLNLQGTELVVLSACETGLGQVAAGEGVFGLRRALQVAGAEVVLMSMWSVPDRETQELMTGFYGKWLGGKEKHAALREAQLELRETVRVRYGEDLPY
jgi:CHAT domain-containing protein